MALKSTSLHVRISDDLIQRIDAFAADAGANNRSEVIRLCITAVLDDDLQQAAVRQIILQSQSIQRIVIGRLMNRLQVEMPRMLEEALDETSGDLADAAAE